VGNYRSGGTNHETHDRYPVDLRAQHRSGVRLLLLPVSQTVVIDEAAPMGGFIVSASAISSN
jgi:hypothetical protein